jgi:parvulin-like peptidyl-prolyl isomerase
MLPNERPLEPLRAVARTFGRDFAQALLSVEKRAWTGPVRSAFGLHIVFVRERTEAVIPNLDQVRPLVERDYLADRRKRELNAMYERMLENYRVTMELSPEKNNTEAAGVTDTERGK